MASSYQDLPVSGSEVSMSKCVDGGVHTFQPIKVKNDTTNHLGQAGVYTPVGIEGGLKGQSEHDHGERLVLFCSKCGKTQGELGGTLQSSRLDNDVAKGGCCVVT